MTELIQQGANTQSPPVHAGVLAPFFAVKATPHQHLHTKLRCDLNESTSLGGLRPTTSQHRTTPMTNDDLKSMSVDELWNLHQELVAELGRKIATEKARLEERLRQIGSPSVLAKQGRPRRPYPKVLPKYRNPKNASETWAGRGKQPRWLRAQLRSGKKLEDFRIQRSSAR